MQNFVLLSSFKISKMTSMSLLSPVLSFGTISVVHFHHFSTHTTYDTLVRVICDFCHIEYRFTTSEIRCLEKRVNPDCVGIQQNSTY